VDRVALALGLDLETETEMGLLMFLVWLFREAASRRLDRAVLASGLDMEMQRRLAQQWELDMATRVVFT
jgi:hypothetical protein